jgi:hypothetical protein
LDRKSYGRAGTAGITTLAVVAAAALGLLTEPAAGGGADVLLYQSGKVRYVVVKDTQGPGSMSLDVECPVGTRAAGGGGAITGNSASSDIAGLFPFDTGDNDGDADDGFALEAFRGALVGSVRIRLVAICLKGGQNDLVYGEHPDTVSAGTLSAANLRACPAGSRLTGAGLEVDAANPNVSVRQLSADLQGGAIDPFELVWGIFKTGGEMPVVAHTMCLQTDGLGMRYVLERKLLADDELATLRADCPGRTRAVGGGYGGFTRSVLSSAPFDDGDRGKAPDDGWATKLFGSPDPAPDYVQAFCVK